MLKRTTCFGLLLNVCALAMLMAALVPATPGQASPPNKPPPPPSGQVMRTASITLTPDSAPSTGLEIEWDAGPMAPSGPSGESNLIPPPPPWETLMTETFEGTFPSTGWRAFDKDGATYGEYFWDDDDYKPHAGSWSAWCANGGANGLDPQSSNYPDHAQSWMVYGPFSLASYNDAYLDFYYWNKSELNYDWFGWWASIDGAHFYGSTVGGDSGGWQYVPFHLTTVPTLGDVTGHSQVWIAFTFGSDGSNTDQGAFVDDVELWGYPEEHLVYLPLTLRNFPPQPRVPNDPLYAGDWRFQKVQAANAWGLNTADGTIVAILDSGVNLNHPELQGVLWVNSDEVPGNGVDDDGNGYADDVHGYDFYDDDSDPSDADLAGFHGTNVALIAGAQTNNGAENAALGWGTRIMAVKVGGATTWNPDILDEAIRYAADNGADVINMSLHTNAIGCTTNLMNAVAHARGLGVVLVTASYRDGNYVPVQCGGVIGVSATDQNDTVVDPAWVEGTVYTNNDVAAPGNATSYAAPWVSALAALLRARYPTYTEGQIAAAILCNTDYISSQYGRAGSGRINAYKAMLNGASCTPGAY